MLEFLEPSEILGNSVQLGHDVLAKRGFHIGHGEVSFIFFLILIIINRLFTLFIVAVNFDLGFAIIEFLLEIFFRRLKLTFFDFLATNSRLGAVFLDVTNGAVIGRVEINNITKKNTALFKFLAPDHNGFKGQSRFAKPLNHRIAARFDAFRNGNFALAREKLNDAHFAQIHAHRIIRAV